MAGRQRKQPRDQENPLDEYTEESSFNPEDFEDITLPSGAPSQEEYEDINLDFSSFPAQPPSSKVLTAKKHLEEQLLLSVAEQALSSESGTDKYGFENIIGVGVSEKMVGGIFTGKECVTVYVVSKEPIDSIHPQAVVPRQVNGVPTDVVATGELNAFPHKGRYRPAPGGVSVGHYQITAGTLGCLVRRGNALYILSNNHVLAKSNAAQIGDPILQPGPFDGGVLPTDAVARLSEFVQIRFDDSPNLTDCAIAQASPSLVSPQNKCIGSFKPNPLSAFRFMIAKKCGRSTQFTRGIVTDVNATVRVGYGTAGTALFQDQIIIMGIPFIAPFSAPGDSGSLIVAEFFNRPIGLLFAGSFTHTIANKIENVLSALNVSIVT